jgi:hypothetical protein
MNTLMGDCQEKSGTTSRKRPCLTCEIGAFCRNHYYRGKLLTERDFRDEQRYQMDKLRLHHVALHGWGIVCGLRLHPHPHCPDRRIVLEPGLAIDDCGREIRVMREVEINLPLPPPRPQEPPCSDDEGTGGEAQKTGEPLQADVGQQQEKNHHGGHQAEHEHADDLDQDDEEHPLPANPCDDRPSPQDLYLCLRYAECETEFAVAPFDDCGCNDSGQKPNRICEGFEVDVLTEKPDWWDKAVREPCAVPDCELLFRRDAVCPEMNRFGCLPLALLQEVEPGMPVDVRQIDYVNRRELSSTYTLEQVIRCILDKLPTREITRISEINWEHGDRLECNEFMRQYTGGHGENKGFRIEFTSPVSAQSIDTRSFMAVIVYRPENMSDPRSIEVAPVHIAKDADQTKWCTLLIDSGYARRHLDGHNFDLFLTLKCNVITGMNGLAVDGDYLAKSEEDDIWRMDLPSGNNVPGGTFESWIRVRPRPRSGSPEQGQKRSAR